MGTGVAVSAPLGCCQPLPLLASWARRDHLRCNTSTDDTHDSVETYRDAIARAAVGRE